MLHSPVLMTIKLWAHFELKVPKNVLATCLRSSRSPICTT